MTQQVLPYIKESGNVLAFTVGSVDQLVIDADQEFMMKGNIYINTSNTALTGVDLSGHGLTSVTRYVRFTLSTLTFALSTDDSASTIDEMNCAKVVFDGSGIATVTAYANKGLEDNVEKTSRTQDYDMIIGDADEVASGVATHTTSGFIDGNLSNNDRILILDGTYDPGVVTISRTGLTVRCQSYSTVITTDDALTFSGNNCDIELPNVSNASNVSVSGTGSRYSINNVIYNPALSTMITYTDDGSVPTGWTEYTAARGRMIVGLPSGGTNEGTLGTAFTNQQSRSKSVAHVHSGPEHSHKMGINMGSTVLIYTSGGAYGTSGTITMNRQVNVDTNYGPSAIVNTKTSSENGGNTGGMSANSSVQTSDILAYIQLIAIKKD